MEKEKSVYGLYFPYSGEMGNEIYNNFKSAYNAAKEYVDNNSTRYDEVAVVSVKVAAILSRILRKK